MATTTNFGWDTPDDTDLVKDGAAAIRTALNGVDTSFVDLKGGTTGQVLSKTSGTDLDFTWITDATGMANPMTTTGDTIYSSSGSTPDRLGIGSTGDVLTVAGGVPSWAPPAAAGGTWTLLNTGGTSLSTTTTTVSGISAQTELMIVLVGASNGTTGPNSALTMRFNSDTASNYQIVGGSQSGNVSYSPGITNSLGSLTTSIALATSGGNQDSVQNGYVHLMGADSTGIKLYTGAFGASPGTSNDTQKNQYFGGWYSGSSAISSVSAICANAWDAGTIYVYGKA
jgi:hypothetical protein